MANAKTKKAVIIGINYRGLPAALGGCINDALAMKEELLKRGYTEADITLLTDDTPAKPTRANILRVTLDLVLSDAKDLFFHYSGHGSQTQDLNGDEVDGKDECLVPLDYMSGRMIIDDELRGILNSLTPQQKLFCVLDCCHSGTGFDLTYNLYERYAGKNLAMMCDGKHPPTKGECVMISGCLDSQVAAETWSQGKIQGALTHSFILALNKGVHTYESLIREIKANLKREGHVQRPNLSSGKSLNLKSRFMI